MNPLLRDLQRQLVTSSTLVVIGLLVLAAVGIVASTSGAVGGMANVAITMEYSGKYEFSIFASDNTGAPVAGDRITIVLSVANDSGHSLGSAVGITSPAGLATLEIDVARGNYTFNERSSMGEGFGTVLKAPTPNVVVPVFGVFSVAERGELGLTNWILVAFPAPFGSVVPGLTLAYYVNETAAGSGGQNITGDLGPFTTPDRLVRFAVPPATVPGNPIGLYLENSSGGVVAKATFGLGVLNAPPGQEGPAGTPVLLWIEEMAPLIMMGAAVLGYVAYGRDRISGAIEPVIALPLGRLQVPALRMLNSAVSLAIGVTAAEAVLAVELERSFGVALPWYVYGAIWLGGMGEGVTMVALVFLLSHVSRSHATVLAGGLSLAFVFTLFWALLTLLISRFLGVSNLVSDTLSWQGSVGLLSPAAAGLNPVGWALGAEAPHGSALIALAPDPGLAALAIILWLALPIAGFFVLVRFRD
ncbi:MAG: ABC transporter permease subunit [Thermoplasmata archaeon]